MSSKSEAPVQPTMGDQRLESILATAESMFFDKGYRGVSIRDLAGAVGVQMSSLYYYFPSKDDILYRIIKYYLDGILEVAEDAIKSTDGSSHAQKLQYLIRQSVIYLAEHRKAAGISLSDVHELPDDRRQEIRDIIACYENIYLHLVRSGIESGEFIDADPNLATYPILGAEARVSAWFNPAGRLTPEEVGDTYAYLLTRSLVADPASLQG